MGCGCNKNKLGNRTNPARGGLVSRQNPTPATPSSSVRARNSGVAPAQKLNSTGVMADQKRVQQIRRNAILRNLGKKR